MEAPVLESRAVMGVFLIVAGLCLLLAMPGDVKAALPEGTGVAEIERRIVNQNRMGKTHLRGVVVDSNTPYATFVHELKMAPFPYAGKYADTRTDFFDTIDPETHERFHTNRLGERYSERDHYSDSSVLFHIPSHFNPRKPFKIVVFFHGNGTDVRKTVADYHLTEQIDASERNVILVVPQLARNAADSSPGKLFRKGAFNSLMHEAAHVLASKLGKSCLEGLENAPIILAAFSGGYKSVAYVLDRGGVSPRIRGVLLLDALYDDMDKFVRWITKNARRSFFADIYTEGSGEENTTLLAAELRGHHIPFKREWPAKISKGDILLIQSFAGHLAVPVQGPPADPLTKLLLGLSF